MTRSGSTLRLAGSATIGVVGLLASVATGEPALAAAIAPFLVVLLAGLVVGGRPAAHVDVRLGEGRVLTGDEVEVHATVTASSAGHRVRVELDVPDGLTLVDGEPSFEDLAVGGHVRVSWTVRAERWGGTGPLRVTVVASDRFGLYATEAMGSSGSLRVLPEEQTLRRILAPRTLRSVPGGHASRHRGEGIEFADLRPFVSGDRARSVNWRASARRGELWVDDRHPDRSGEVVLFLDSFASAGVDRDSTLRRTVEAATTLAGRHIAANDRIGLVDLGGIFRWVRPGGGTVQLYRIVEALVDTEVYASAADKPLEVIPVRALPRRSLVVALTPLLDPRGVGTLLQMRARGFDVVVLEVSPAGSIHPGPGRRGALAHRLWEIERARTRADLRRLGIGIAEWGLDVPLDPLLDELLVHREAVARWAR